MYSSCRIALNNTEKSSAGREATVSCSEKADADHAEKKACKSGQMFRIGCKSPITDIHRKKAIREIERSSWGDRDEAKMERNTAGVTGMRRCVSLGGS